MIGNSYAFQGFYPDEIVARHCFKPIDDIPREEMSVKRYEFGMTNAPTEYQSPTMHQDANGGYVSYEDYTALEARCAALAAELSAVLTDRAVILEDLDNTCFEIGMQRGEKVDAYPTPTVANHDAFLAEVRAQGVEMFAERKNNEMMSLHPDTHAVGSIAAEMSSQVKQLREFAAQLRKGVQS